MGLGLQVWDENGVNLVDTDYRMTQIIGSVYTPDLLAGNAYVNGSIHVPEFAGLAGTPFVHHIPYPIEFNIRNHNQPGSTNGWRYKHASSVRVEGNYVKWIYTLATFSNGQTYETHDFASLIIWGVF